MKQMKQNTHELSFGEIGIKVFHIGNTPKIKKGDLSAQNPNALKSIHSHFTYEILFVTNGSLRLVTEDTVKTYEHAVIVVPPYRKHCSYPNAEGSFCLLFSIETPHTAAALIQKLEQGINAFPITEEISFYIRTLSQKCELHTDAALRDLPHLTALLFSAVLQAVSPKQREETEKTGSNRAHIEAIETFIHGNLYRKFTLSDVSAHIFLSTRQISRIIEREYGVSFSALVADKRLASAEMLLKNTDFTIAKIASETFPGTESYFYTCFKKKFGMSPLQYRKASKG